MRISLHTWHGTLIASLGLNALPACGGATDTGANASSAPDAAGAVPASVFPCRNPTPLGGGFIQCEGGFMHRRAPEDCPAPPAPGSACAPGSECTVDSDCPGQGYKRCLLNTTGACSCQYGCHNDTDCGPSADVVCACASIGGATLGQCMNVGCKADADCGGLLCASALTPPVSGCGQSTFACQTASDECAGDVDCAGAQCFWNGSRRVCEVHPCVTGRPFVVSGVERMSASAPRCDWAAGREAPGTSDLSTAHRNRLCQEWTRIALMEHASIAAFAQFTLQLLALGAPPDLVEASQQAALDETEHARLAFALATVYGGRPIGPGPLDVRGVLGDAADSTSVIESAIAGGCVNETIAAIEAAEALQGATDPAVRAAFTRIARDEAQHATLAWRFVKWALECADPRLHHAARTGLLSLLERAEVPVLPDEAKLGASSRPGASVETGDALVAHGHLSDSKRQEIAKRALVEVICPCAEALLAATTRAYPVAA